MRDEALSQLARGMTPHSHWPESSTNQKQAQVLSFSPFTLTMFTYCAPHTLLLLFLQTAPSPNPSHWLALSCAVIGRPLDLFRIFLHDMLTARASEIVRGAFRLDSDVDMHIEALLKILP